jgi:hypothetical protein
MISAKPRVMIEEVGTNPVDAFGNAVYSLSSNLSSLAPDAASNRLTALITYADPAVDRQDCDLSKVLRAVTEGCWTLEHVPVYQKDCTTLQHILTTIC